jgi:hypothetical protein
MSAKLGEPTSGIRRRAGATRRRRRCRVMLTVRAGNRFERVTFQAPAAILMYTASEQHHNRRWRRCAGLASRLHRRSQAPVEVHAMDDRFTVFTRSLATGGSRRYTLGIMLSAALGALGLAEVSARNRHHRKRKKHKHIKPKHLREVCSPGKDKCSDGLKCDSPTTRHTCSSTVQGVSTWCCVPPGGSCTECDCCGDNYCEFDDNNQPHCVPNPEG